MSNILKGLNESLSTLSPEQVEQLKKQLEIAKQGFDPNYQYSDDYSFWKKQNDKAQTISRLTKILNTAGVELQEEGVAEGLPQTLRKVVPGYAKREIDKKMDSGKFGKTDADKDANFQRYKKIQDKIKDQGVAEGLGTTPKITFAQQTPGSWTRIDILVNGDVKFQAVKTMGPGHWTIHDQDGEVIGSGGNKTQLKASVLDYLSKQGVAEESDKQFAQRMKKKAAQPPTKGMSQKEKEDKGWAKPKEQGVAEGLNEFAPDGFNGGDDDEGFSPEIAKMAQEDGFTKGVSLADGATLERAMTINHWHSQHGGMYKQYFAKGFKQGRINKIKHDNKQYNLNLQLMKDGSIRHGEQGVAEGSEGNWYVRVKGKVLKDKKFNAIPFPSQEAAHSKAMELHSKKRIPLSQLKLTSSWMDAPEQGVAEGQLDELSPQTLASYKKKAGSDATAADKRGDYKRGDKRMSGIIKATKKEFDNDSKGVKEGYRYDSGDYSNARMGREYGKKNLSVDSGAYEFEKEVHRNEPGGEHGRPKSLKGVSKSLPADAFGRTTGEIPAGKKGRVHNLMPNTVDEEKQRLDPKCWTGKHKEGTKMKGGVRVNNCVPNESVNESAILQGLKKV